jgi:hypothetical protein
VVDYGGLWHTSESRGTETGTPMVVDCARLWRVGESRGTGTETGTPMDTQRRITTVIGAIQRFWQFQFH